MTIAVDMWMNWNVIANKNYLSIKKKQVLDYSTSDHGNKIINLKKIKYNLYANKRKLTCGESKGYLGLNLNCNWNFSPSYSVPVAPSRSTNHLKF